MKFIFIALLFGIILCEKNLNVIPETYDKVRFKYGNHTINKPLFHFSPDYGWMNDPNGCWYDSTNKLWHLYFQYYPSDTIWTMPLYWGHAVSKNLMLWKQQEIAIAPIDGNSGAYSGSIFLDDDNVFSMFWNRTDEGNTIGDNNKVIAAWTYTDPDWLEYQYLSYSLDNGYTFRTPENGTLGNNKNPVAVLTAKTKEYRDPQVIKVAKGVYVMSVAKSHDYEIAFLRADSTTGYDFSSLGTFGIIGYLGYQYECPNLVHLSCSDCPESGSKYTESSYWVLFISINPGSIQGGSSTQYFVGTFNYDFGQTTEPFVPVDRRTTVIDYGKDFYAMQLFFQTPGKKSEDSDEVNPFDSVTGVGWASNWQYTALVPTDPWRSSMSIPREIKLKFYQPADNVIDSDIFDPSPKLLYVAQKPLLDEIVFDSYEEKTKFSYTDKNGDPQTGTPSETGFKLEDGHLYHVDLTDRAYGALEFFLEYGVKDGYSNDNPGYLTIFLNGSSIPEEYLRIGHNNKADAFFIDRGHTNVQWCHENPFFTDKVSVNIYKKAINNGYAMFSVHGIIDRNIIELFFNEEDDYSIITSTNTFFFTGGNFIGSIDIKVNANTKGKEGGYIITKFSAKQLVPKSTSTYETVSSARRQLKETDL